MDKVCKGKYCKIKIKYEELISRHSCHPVSYQVQHSVNVCLVLFTMLVAFWKLAGMHIIS